MKKYNQKIIGNSGVISKRYQLLIIAEDHYLRIYDLELLKSIKKIRIKNILRLALDTNEELLYCIKQHSIEIITLKDLEHIDTRHIQLPGIYTNIEWEFTQCDCLRTAVLGLVAILLGGKQLILIYDLNKDIIIPICEAEFEDKIYFIKDKEIQITSGETYKPKAKENIISCKRDVYDLEKLGHRVYVKITRAIEMTLKKMGFLCFEEPEDKFYLIKECRFWQSYYVFLNADKEVVASFEAPTNSEPNKIQYIPECHCLVLMYTQKTVIINTENNYFQIRKMLDTDIAKTVLWMKNTEQLLILNSTDQGIWVDWS